jgi:hypothetical protein
VVPAALALAGPALLVLVTRGAFALVALLWWAGALLLARLRPRSRRVVTVILVPVCVVTAFEGGLFMLPALIALAVIDARLADGQTSSTMPR